MNKEKADLCKQNSYVSNENEAVLFSHNKLIREARVKTVDEFRQAGIDGYEWTGSRHYKNNSNIEPLDLMNANGTLEDFSIGSIIKYAYRFKETKSLRDLAKIIDYAYILYGMAKGE